MSTRSCRLGMESSRRTMMNAVMTLLSVTLLLVATMATNVAAFQCPVNTVKKNRFAVTSTTTTTTTTTSTSLFGYVPSGFKNEAEYKAFKAKEEAQKKKNLGGLGPRGFKSRSFQSFQEALERGEAEHLLPVFNAKEKIKKGILKEEDIPYMQRGGSWDNSDVKGAKKKKWLSSDKDYAGGGFRKEQSVSIFGKGEGLDWTGVRGRSGPEGIPIPAPKISRNYKPPNVNTMKGVNVNKKNQRGGGGGDEEQPKKKFFGLF